MIIYNMIKTYNMIKINNNNNNMINNSDKNKKILSIPFEMR